ncbi:MAG: nucleotide exchange factor GrpE [Candidatus Rickettsia vulgarisii]
MTNETNENSEQVINSDQLQEIVNLKEQNELLQDKLLRTVAESENLKKRLEKTIADTREYAIFSFAKDLLAVNDNLIMALDHKPKNIDGEVANIVTGIEMTKSELSNIFAKHGLETIAPKLGEKFDYNIHHAVSQIISEEYEQDSIISVMQLGYKIKDRLLRPAMVQVAKLPS